MFDYDLKEIIMVSNKVKEYREKILIADEFKVTKAHLAWKIGVSRSYVTKLEKGEICPSLAVAQRLALYLNCKLDDLFPLKS